MRALSSFPRPSQATAATYLSAPFGLSRALDKGAIQPNLRTVKISRNDALKSAALTLDVTNPALLNFDIDVGNGILYLNFDEPIVAADSSYNPPIVKVSLTAFTILSATNGSGATFVFSAVKAALLNDTTVQLFVSVDDMNNVKLAVSGSSCASLALCTQIKLDSLLVTANAAFDFYGNYLPANSLKSLIPVRRFIADTVPPLLQSTVLDLSAGTITISFNEIVRLGSFRPTDLTIYNGAQQNTSDSLRVRLWPAWKRALSAHVRARQPTSPNSPPRAPAAHQLHDAELRRPLHDHPQPRLLLGGPSGAGARSTPGVLRRRHILYHQGGTD